MILFLLHLAGAAALLLWAIRLIRTGVERAFMTQLRLVLRRSERRRTVAVVSGAAAALLLQSSTAVVLIVASLAESGGLLATAGLILVLGADLGSAVAAQILLFRVGWLVPLLLVVGATLFLRGQTHPARQAGRILTGLALVFVSIDMIREATAPLQDSTAVGFLVSYLDGDLVSAFAIGALLAYAVHSSLAAVLMFATFVAGGVLSVAAGTALVLGANLGGAVIPFVLTYSMSSPARRMVLANLLLRGGAAVLALLVLIFGTPDLAGLAAEPQRQVILVHLIFNFGLVLLGLLVAGPTTRLVARLVPDRGKPADSGPPSALDPGALEDPERALACAQREVLNMGEQVAAMLTPALGLYRTWDPDVAEAIAQIEDRVDRMHFETKLFIARLQEGRLSNSQSRRAMDLATTANHLEDAGDHISTNMLDIAQRMRNQGLSFSEDGWRDLQDFHACVSSNAQLALNVMMSGEPGVARQLLKEKDRVRRFEQALQARHLERLRSGAIASVETSNLHQETLRSLKQVNTAFSWAAYPIAEAAGDLRPSRLADSQSDKKGPPSARAELHRPARS